VLIIVGVAGEVAGGADMTQPQTAIHAVAHAGVVSLLTLIFGITAVAGEYRHKTITDTYLATPRRGRVIAAIGVSLGALIPNLAAAIATALAWIALVEGLIGELLSDLEAWLPFAGGQVLGRLPGAPDISQWAGGLLLAGYAVVFAAIALTTSVRLDIT
jgi:ABC-2 type transport system permease protein